MTFRMLGALVAWCVVWVPFSFAFPQIGHAPSGLFAPVLGLAIALDWFDGVPIEQGYVGAILLPCLVFWIGLGAALTLAVLTKRTPSAT